MQPGRLFQPVAEYLRDLQASGRAEATQRSYGMDLLRWFRFCWAIGLPWDQATRAEARDFARRLQLADKPVTADAGGTPTPPARLPYPVTGKPPLGSKYAPATSAHSETVLRHFYDFHLEAGTGPIANPFPLARAARGRNANAHRNPMDPYRTQRSGQFRPRPPQRIPRSIPDEKFNKLFTALPSLRDRALVAFWISTGARASELLRGRCSSYRPHQMRSCGCGSTRPRSTGRFPRGGMSRCGGRCGARSGRSPTAPRGVMDILFARQAP